MSLFIRECTEFKSPSRIPDEYCLNEIFNISTENILVIITEQTNRIES